MEPDIDKLIHKLKDLQNKTQQIDDFLKDLRITIHNLLWDLIEIKKVKSTKNQIKM